jgi:hypothetical protein
MRLFADAALAGSIMLANAKATTTSSLRKARA